MPANWMTDHTDLTERLRTINWRKLPKLTEGDAKVIAATAGAGDEAADFESDLYGLIVDVDAAIGDLEDAREGGDREQVAEARETRDGAVEEFLDAVRRRLLPDVVAADDAEAAAAVSESLTGLGLL